MKRVCAIVLSLITCCWNIPLAAQTTHHFVSTVLSQSGLSGGMGGNGMGDAVVLRHSTTNGGYAYIGTHINSYDDGSYFVYDTWSYTNVFDGSWNYYYQDTVYAELAGYRVDNGNGTTTIYTWNMTELTGASPAYSGVTVYVESNSVLAAAPSTSLQDILGLIDNDAHGPVSMFGINWKCMILAANDPICDELAVIFGPEAWLPCVLVIYELCVHVEQLPPL